MTTLFTYAQRICMAYTHLVNLWPSRGNESPGRTAPPDASQQTSRCPSTGTCGHPQSCHSSCRAPLAQTWRQDLTFSPRHPSASAPSPVYYCSSTESRPLPHQNKMKSLLLELIAKFFKPLPVRMLPRSSQRWDPFPSCLNLTHLICQVL